VTRLWADLIVSYYANTSGGTTLYRVDGTNGTLLDSTFVNGVWLLELSTMMGELYGVEVFGELIHHIDPATGTILSTADWCLSYAYGVDVSFDHGMVGSTPPCRPCSPWITRPPWMIWAAGRPSRLGRIPLIRTDHRAAGRQLPIDHIAIR
jgi:hypothetical protein